MKRLQQFIHELSWEDLPSKMRDQAKRCLLDTLGAGLAGRATELSAIAHRFADASYRGGPAVMWQDARRVSPPGAALANAMTVDSLDIHDGHSLTKGHAGAAIVPAVLAMADASQRQISGQECLLQLVIGYEVALRSGVRLHRTASDYHSSGAWNAIGCAAAAARSLRLSAAQTLEALGIAEYLAPRSPMMRCIDHPTMIKDGSGWGALTGVSAALMAGEGFTGAPAALTDAADREPEWRDLGQSWYMLDQYFKPHAVCRWAQAAVEGALQLRARHKLDPNRIREVKVATFHEARRLAVVLPRTTEEAQYSLPFPTAVALCYGTIEPFHLVGDGLVDPLVCRLASRIQVVESPRYCQAFPARRYADVEVATESGDRHQVIAAQPRWDADARPSTVELLEKFRRLTSFAPAPLARELEQTLVNFPELASVSALGQLLAGMPQPAVKSACDSTNDNRRGSCPPRV